MANGDDVQPMTGTNFLPLASQAPVTMPPATPQGPTSQAGAPTPAAPPQKGFIGRLASHFHDANVGRIVKSVMGTDTQFQEQPDGSVKPVDVPQKPGTLFRGMLLSAILGSGTQAHTFGEGVAKGVSAAGERYLSQQAQQRQQTIQNIELKRQKQKDIQEKQRMDDEHVEHSARVELDKVQTLHLQYALDHVPVEEFNKINAAADLALREAEASGGQQTPVIVNGKNINGVVGNSKDWEAALQKDPSLFHSPDLQHRRAVVTSQNIPEGAHIKDGEWVDANGKRLDMHNYSTVRIMDIPVDSLKQMRDMTGAEANAMIGTKQFDPSAKLHLALSDIFNMKSSIAKDALDAAKIKAEEARAKAEEALANKSREAVSKAAETQQRDDLKALVSVYDTQYKAVKELLDEEQKSESPDQGKIAQFQSQMSQLRQGVIDAAKQLNPRIGVAEDKARKEKLDKLPKASKPGTPITPDIIKLIGKSFPDENDAIQAARDLGYGPPAAAAQGTTPSATPESNSIMPSSVTITP